MVSVGLWALARDMSTSTRTRSSSSDEKDMSFMGLENAIDEEQQIEQQNEMFWGKFCLYSWIYTGTITFNL